MKLPHVIALSIIGMLVTSLSVLVLTSSRGASSAVDLTSNELEPVVELSATPTPKLTLTLEPVTTASSVVPRTNSTEQAAIERREAFGSLQLTAVDKPCSFFIDGKPIKVENEVPLMVRIGSHKVRCERPNGDAIEKRVEVVEEAINPVFF
jgi:hypothetical protein